MVYYVIYNDQLRAAALTKFPTVRPDLEAMRFDDSDAIARFAQSCWFNTVHQSLSDVRFCREPGLQTGHFSFVWRAAGIICFFADPRLDDFGVQRCTHGGPCAYGSGIPRPVNPDVIPLYAKVREMRAVMGLDTNDVRVHFGPTPEGEEVIAATIPVRDGLLSISPDEPSLGHIGDIDRVHHSAGVRVATVIPDGFWLAGKMTLQGALKAPSASCVEAQMGDSLSHGQIQKMIQAAKISEASKKGLGKGVKPGNSRPAPRPNASKAKAKTTAKKRKSKSCCIDSRSKTDQFIAEAQSGGGLTELLAYCIEHGVNVELENELAAMGIEDLDSLETWVNEQRVHPQGIGIPVYHSVDAGLLNNLSGMIDALRGVASDLSRGVGHASASLGNRVEDLTNRLSAGLKHTHHVDPVQHDVDVSSNLLETAAIFLVAGLAVYSYRNPSKYLTIFNTVCLGVWLLYRHGSNLREWVTWLGDLLKEQFGTRSGPQAIEPQGMTVSTNSIANVATGAVLASVFRSLNSKTTLELVEEFGKKSINMKKIHEGLSFTIDFFASIIEEAISWVSTMLGGERIQLKSDPYWEVRQYGVKVAQLCDEYHSNPLQDSAFVGRIEMMIGEGEKLRVAISHITGPQTSLEVGNVSSMLQALHKVKSELAARSITISGTRPEPMMVSLLGPPGVGKTAFAQYAWHMIAANLLPEDKLPLIMKNDGDFVYTYNQQDDYWSGYNGQFCTMVDELGFVKEALGGRSVFGDIVRMVNINPANLQQASLHEKGRSYFVSELIMATSNRRHLNDIENLNDRTAVFRRMHMTYVVGISDDFCTEDTKQYSDPWERKPDLDKMRAELSYGDTHHLLFYKMKDLDKGTYEAIPISGETVIQTAIDHHRKSVRSDKSMAAAIKGKMQGVINARLKAKDLPIGLPEVTPVPFRQPRVPSPEPTYPGGWIHSPEVHRLIPARALPLVAPSAQMGEEIACLCPVCDPTLVKGALQSWREIYQRCGMLAPDGQVILGNQKVPLAEADLDDWHHVPMYQGCVRMAPDAESARGAMSHALHMNGVRAQKVVIEKLNPEGTALARAIKYGKYLIGFLGAAAVLYKVFSLFTTGGADEAQGEMPYAMKRKAANAKMRRHRVQMQHGEDPSTNDAAVKLVTKCMMRVRFEFTVAERQQGENPTGVVTVLQNHVILMPSHFPSTWVEIANGGDGMPADPKAKVIFYGYGSRNANTGVEKPKRYEILLKDLLCDDGDGTYSVEVWDVAKTPEGVPVDPDDPGEDMVLMYIEGLTGRNITKMFRSRDDDNPPRNRGVLAILNRDLAQTYYTADYEIGSKPLTYIGKAKDEDNEPVKYRATEHIVYGAPTRRGDCGSLFLLYDKHSDHKIASMHVAGNGTIGYGILVYREDLENAIRQMAFERGFGRDIGMEAAHPKEKPFVQIGEPVTDVGFVTEAKGKPVPAVMKSTQAESPIYGKIEGWEPKTAPAMMRRTNGIDPMENARDGYGLTAIVPEKTKLAAATTHMIECLFKHSSPVEESMRRVVTFEEAVAGIKGSDHAMGINRGTSPGFPFRHIPEADKQLAFGFDEFEFGSEGAQFIRECVENFEARILVGERPWVIFMDFLKDERRKLQRVAEGKTRLISAAAVAYVIALRKYTLGFSAWVMENGAAGGPNGIACGINPYGPAWGHLAYRHGGNAEGTRVIAGDYSGFDKTLSYHPMMSIKEAMSAFYADHGEDSERIRNALLDEIPMSRHICGDAIYSWMGSNPSGNPLTTILNSWANNILFRLAILQMRDPEHKMEFEELHKILKESEEEVVFTAYGDDNLISVSRGGKFDDITQESLAEAMKAFGMVYTDESKDGSAGNDRRLSECTFLKRGFVRTHYSDRHRWMAPLALDTIMESIQWTKNHDTTCEYWKANVDHMIDELSAHGKEVFDREFPRIAKACASVKGVFQHQPVITSFAHCQRRFVGKDNFH